MRKINEFIAVRITLAFGTIWAFYLFILYGLFPAIWPQYTDKILYWSNFLQLIALPAIMLGQNILGRSAEKRAQQDHEAIMEELQEIRDMHAELHEILKKVNEQ